MSQTWTQLKIFLYFYKKNTTVANTCQSPKYYAFATTQSGYIRKKDIYFWIMLASRLAPVELFRWWFQNDLTMESVYFHDCPTISIIPSCQRTKGICQMYVPIESNPLLLLMSQWCLHWYRKVFKLSHVVRNRPFLGTYELRRTITGIRYQKSVSSRSCLVVGRSNFQVFHYTTNGFVEPFLIICISYRRYNF